MSPARMFKAMVGVTKIQRGNAGYWLAAVAEGGEDYYTKPGEAPGEWVGELADELGLYGQVEAAGYTAILEGREPASGAQLVRRPAARMRERPDGSERRVEPVLGYDVRFSAPKSVSLLYVFGNERTRTRVISVMNEAVRQGIAHLETEACVVQRGRKGRHIERGEGFVGMAFRHRMSRAGDPALHVHVVISNLTRAARDGKWLSLASPKGRSLLYPHGKSAGVVFQAALRAGLLREFGLEFDDVKNGYADLKGFSREAVEAFSTRSREIAHWLEEHGVSSVQAAQTAAYRTRAAKDHGIDASERVTEWERRAEPFGLSAQSAAQMVEEARPREPRALDDADLDAALLSVESRTSHFDRRALLWALANELPEGAELTTLNGAVDRLLASERVLCVHESRGPLDPAHYTTPRLAEAERRFIDGALAGADAGVAQVSLSSVGTILDRHSYLGADQREMVIRLTTGGEQVLAVSAWPGTGKTTALAAAREAWEEAGFTVLGCATARTASGELVDAGVPATSISALLYATKMEQTRGIELPRGVVIIVDEANTTSTFDLEALRTLAAEHGGKLVAIGDPQQIGAVGPGGLYAYLTRVTEPATLTTIRRQHREADQRVVALVHEGRGSEALDLLCTGDKLILGEDLTSTLNGLILDWHRDYASGADAVMIARRNRDVDYLNDQAHELRRSEGALGEAEVIVGERTFAAGDRVQTRINSREVDNRERWDVVAVDAAARTVELRRIGGDERTVRLGPGYLERLTEDGAPALQYAYAVTKFGAEGKTFDRAYPLLDAGANLEQELVAISRGREVANVYAVASSELLDPELGPAKREVSDALHDVREAIEREGADYAAAEVTLRRKIDALRPDELAGRRAKLTAAGRAANPDLNHRDRLDRKIKDDREWVKRLGREREAIERMSEPPAAELARVSTAEISSVERLRRNLAERDSLPELESGAADPKPIDAEARLEAMLVEQRIARLAAREVAAARMGSSKPIHDALGPYPSDPAKARAWGDGAHAIATYRARHNVRDAENVLGAQPRDAPTRAERARTKQRLDAARRQLGLRHERAAERSAGRDLGIGL
ncbi:MAG TPA: MobF family relaxase [Solirubrobacterales bacterium]|nr:MobF family relaxase [Solirubrobacterales bacterium]